ncbi:hypothetical protein BFN03_18735 [Rhodococcus sp. WMMA185]|uniref:DUF2510 domain-containing protein n=1 Tax=Rhodococcus sp. WMMA185 TaxID=679318 RepID=UPI00087835C3|nr:DUF2510 domain-containing protein [Rhodococcus sp. WMMA185]AOW94011.1 hypothetical protein BFN03_18735 [Rhodococcus sp. WMMA185]
MGSPTPWHFLVILFFVVLILAVIAGVVLLIVKAGKSSNKTPSVQAAVPGWYPDPHDPRFVRWHDGRQWTDHTQPRGTDTPGG